MHHFISDSTWDANGVMDKVAKDVSKALPKQKLTGLLIDESGWEKKGDKSVGVGHQYCGNVGKTANSQVAVFGCLCNDKYASLIDARLYLPKAWTDDKERCDQAQIPLDAREFKTKPELALEIIKHQVYNGIAFDYVGGDGLYWNDFNLAQGIDELCLLYILDIHSNQQVYLERPQLYIPERKSNRGRAPKRLRADVEPTKVNDYIEDLDGSQWKKLDIRHSAKGVLKAHFHFKKVYVWDKNTDQVQSRLLVVSKRKNKTGVEIKYSFSNANVEQYTKTAIAQMQAQRFFIEHSFKEQKQVLKMDQFQTRKWLSWYHQMALNMMVGAFLLHEKLFNKDDVPLLPARDIMDFLISQFYKGMTEEGMLKRLQKRHHIRQNDINRYYSRE